MARASKLRKLHGYRMHYILFSRAGFTSALEARAKRERVRLVAGVPPFPASRRGAPAKKTGRR